MMESLAKGRPERWSKREILLEIVDEKKDTFLSVTRYTDGEGFESLVVSMESMLAWKTDAARHFALTEQQTDRLISALRKAWQWFADERAQMPAPNTVLFYVSAGDDSLTLGPRRGSALQMRTGGQVPLKVTLATIQQVGALIMTLETAKNAHSWDESMASARKTTDDDDDD